METWEWVALAIFVGVFALALLTVFVAVRRRRKHLRERFGPEYHRAVSDSGRREAERRLIGVEKAHEELDVRPLPAASRERYLEEWRHAEVRFVSDPREAARTGERLVARVLEERGYPTDVGSEHRAAYVAVDHPDVAERYRHGCAMLEHVDGGQSTENLRKAMIDFRAVFEELLEAERRAA